MQAYCCWWCENTSKMKYCQCWTQSEALKMWLQEEHTLQVGALEGCHLAVLDIYSMYMIIYGQPGYMNQHLHIHTYTQ